MPVHFPAFTASELKAILERDTASGTAAAAARPVEEASTAGGASAPEGRPGAWREFLGQALGAYRHCSCASVLELRTLAHLLWARYRCLPSSGSAAQKWLQLARP